MTNFIEDSIMRLEVQARNSLNAKSIEVNDRLCEILNQYLDKKIIKKTPYTTWISKVGDQIAPLWQELNDQGICLSFTFGMYHVWAELKGHYYLPDNASVRYVTKSFHVAALDGDLLSGCSMSSEKFICNYDVDEIINARNQVKELYEQISKIRCSFPDISI